MSTPKILAFDVETTTHKKGNPFSARNHLVTIGWWASWDNLGGDCVSVYHPEDRSPYGPRVESFSKRVQEADILVGFNIKFDSHWVRRYGVDVRDKILWDCQLVEFIADRQRNPLPSLNDVLAKHGLPAKLDKVAEYWDKGFETTEIPLDLLKEYNQEDARLTYELYLKQRKWLDENPRFRYLIWQSFLDTYNLMEIEWNGFKYDFRRSEQESVAAKTRIDELDRFLWDLTGYRFVNWNSDAHISAVLFGGIVKETYRETYTFVYKDGRTADKERWAVREHVLPALTNPIGVLEKKVGQFPTDAGTLKKLQNRRAVGRIVKALLERAKLDKLRGTYFDGLPSLYAEFGWEEECFHPQMMQCVASTGRLASANPNAQNLAEEVLGCIVSRFK